MINHQTFPTKAEEPPSLETPTATFAGAPPGAFLKAGASASETPPTVGTKSISISPKQTTRVSERPVSIVSFLRLPVIRNKVKIKDLSRLQIRFYPIEHGARLQRHITQGQRSTEA